MQRVGVVAVLYQFVGDLLRLFAGTAEDDAVDVRVEVGDAFQSQVLVACLYHIIDIIFFPYLGVSHMTGQIVRIIGIAHQLVLVARHAIQP